MHLCFFLFEIELRICFFFCSSNCVLESFTMNHDESCKYFPKGWRTTRPTNLLSCISSNRKRPLGLGYTPIMQFVNQFLRIQPMINLGWSTICFFPNESRYVPKKPSMGLVYYLPKINPSCRHAYTVRPMDGMFLGML